MKIGLLQINPTVGDITGNTDKIIDRARVLSLLGKENTCDIIVAPELITVGYPPRDLLYRSDFITANLEARDRLVAFTKSIDAVLAFGYVEPNKEVGKPNFNAICIARHGQIIQQRYKTLLPTYDVFEEDIYFEPGSTEDTNFLPVTISGKEVGFIICEEAWNDKDFWPTRKYDFDPVSQFVKNGANYIIAINASPYRRDILKTRHQMVSAHCKKHNLGFAYCNMVGYNDDVGFDGNSFVMNNSGEVIFQDTNFIESSSVVETHSPPLPFNSYDNDEWQMETVKAITLGIRDYFGKQNITGPAIIGLSGGIDSALVAFLAQMALGKERVIGIGMPSEFSSGHSVTDAEKLAKTLGIQFAVVPIAPMHNASRGAVDAVISQMATGGKPCYLSGITDENLQARERGKLLMAISNYYNGIVLSTGNKSEMAVGYCTIYGDMAGGLAVISDLVKTDVYALCQWINEHFRNEIIPWNTINKLPSAELRLDQHDQQSLPPYELLDQVLKLYVEEYKSPKQIVEKLVTVASEVIYQKAHGRDIKNDILKVCSLICKSQFKRVQSPTGIKLTSKLFKMGYRMPIVHRWN